MSGRVAVVAVAGVLGCLGLSGVAQAGAPISWTSSASVHGRATVPRGAVERRTAKERERARKRAAAKRRKKRMERKLRRDIKSSRGRIMDVIDGRTLIVKTSGAYKKTLPVLVLGTDPPLVNEDGVQDECGGQAATALVAGLIFPNATGRVVVRLSTDPHRPVYDRESGSLLAYVDVAAGARGRGSAAFDVGKTLIASGYSRAVGSTLARAKPYAAAEKAAKQAGKGVWGQCGGNFHSVMAGTR